MFDRALNGNLMEGHRRALEMLAQNLSPDNHLANMIMSSLPFDLVDDPDAVMGVNLPRGLASNALNSSGAHTDPTALLPAATMSSVAREYALLYHMKGMPLAYVPQMVRGSLQDAGLFSVVDGAPFEAYYLFRLGALTRWWTHVGRSMLTPSHATTYSLRDVLDVSSGVEEEEEEEGQALPGSADYVLPLGEVRRMCRDIRSVLLSIVIAECPHRLMRPASVPSLKCTGRVTLCKDPSVIYLWELVRLVHRNERPDTSADSKMMEQCQHVIAVGWVEGPSMLELLTACWKRYGRKVHRLRCLMNHLDACGTEERHDDAHAMEGEEEEVAPLMHLRLPKSPVEVEGFASLSSSSPASPPPTPLAPAGSDERQDRGRRPPIPEEPNDFTRVQFFSRSYMRPLGRTSDEPPAPHSGAEVVHGVRVGPYTAEEIASSCLRSMEECAGEVQLLLWWARCRLLAYLNSNTEVQEKVDLTEAGAFFRSVWSCVDLAREILADRQDDVLRRAAARLRCKASSTGADAAVAAEHKADTLGTGRCTVTAEELVPPPTVAHLSREKSSIFFSETRERDAASRSTSFSPHSVWEELQTSLDVAQQLYADLVGTIADMSHFWHTLRVGTAHISKVVNPPLQNPFWPVIRATVPGNMRFRREAFTCLEEYWQYGQLIDGFVTQPITFRVSTRGRVMATQLVRILEEHPGFYPSLVVRTCASLNQVEMQTLGLSEKLVAALVGCVRYYLPDQMPAVPSAQDRVLRQVVKAEEEEEEASDRGGEGQGAADERPASLPPPVQEDDDTDHDSGSADSSAEEAAEAQYLPSMPSRRHRPPRMFNAVDHTSSEETDTRGSAEEDEASSYVPEEEDDLLTAHVPAVPATLLASEQQEEQGPVLHDSEVSEDFLVSDAVEGPVAARMVAQVAAALRSQSSMDGAEAAASAASEENENEESEDGTSPRKAAKNGKEAASNPYEQSSYKDMPRLTMKSYGALITCLEALRVLVASSYGSANPIGILCTAGPASANEEATEPADVAAAPPHHGELLPLLHQLLCQTRYGPLAAMVLRFLTACVHYNVRDIVHLLDERGVIGSAVSFAMPSKRSMDMMQPNWGRPSEAEEDNAEEDGRLQRCGEKSLASSVWYAVLDDQSYKGVHSSLNLLHYTPMEDSFINRASFFLALPSFFEAVTVHADTHEYFLCHSRWVGSAVQSLMPSFVLNADAADRRGEDQQERVEHQDVYLVTHRGILDSIRRAEGTVVFDSVFASSPTTICSRAFLFHERFQVYQSAMKSFRQLYEESAVDFFRLLRNNMPPLVEMLKLFLEFTLSHLKREALSVRFNVEHLRAMKDKAARRLSEVEEWYLYRRTQHLIVSLHNTMQFLSRLGQREYSETRSSNDDFMWQALSPRVGDTLAATYASLWALMHNGTRQNTEDESFAEVGRNIGWWGRLRASHREEEQQCQTGDETREKDTAADLGSARGECEVCVADQIVALLAASSFGPPLGTDLLLRFPTTNMVPVATAIRGASLALCNAALPRTIRDVDMLAQVRQGCDVPCTQYAAAMFLTNVMTSFCNAKSETVRIPAGRFRETHLLMRTALSEVIHAIAKAMLLGRRPVAPALADILTEEVCTTLMKRVSVWHLLPSRWRGTPAQGCFSFLSCESADSGTSGLNYTKTDGKATSPMDIQKEESSSVSAEERAGDEVSCKVGFSADAALLWNMFYSGAHILFREDARDFPPPSSSQTATRSDAEGDEPPFSASLAPQPSYTPENTTLRLYKRALFYFFVQRMDQDAAAMGPEDLHEPWAWKGTGSSRNATLEMRQVNVVSLLAVCTTLARSMDMAMLRSRSAAPMTTQGIPYASAVAREGRRRRGGEIVMEERRALLEEGLHEAITVPVSPQDALDVVENLTVDGLRSMAWTLCSFRALYESLADPSHGALASFLLPLLPSFMFLVRILYTVRQQGYRLHTDAAREGMTAAMVEEKCMAAEIYLLHSFSCMLVLLRWGEEPSTKSSTVCAVIAQMYMLYPPQVHRAEEQASTPPCAAHKDAKNMEVRAAQLQETVLVYLGRLLTLRVLTLARRCTKLRGNWDATNHRHDLQRLRVGFTQPLLSSLYGKPEDAEGRLRTGYLENLSPEEELKLLPPSYGVLSPTARPPMSRAPTSPPQPEDYIRDGMWEARPPSRSNLDPRTTSFSSLGSAATFAFFNKYFMTWVYSLLVPPCAPSQPQQNGDPLTNMAEEVPPRCFMDSLSPAGASGARGIIHALLFGLSDTSQADTNATGKTTNMQPVFVQLLQAVLQYPRRCAALLQSVSLLLSQKRHLMTVHLLSFTELPQLMMSRMMDAIQEVQQDMTREKDAAAPDEAGEEGPVARRLAALAVEERHLYGELFTFLNLFRSHICATVYPQSGPAAMNRGVRNVPLMREEEEPCAASQRRLYYDACEPPQCDGYAQGALCQDGARCEHSHATFWRFTEMGSPSEEEDRAMSCTREVMAMMASLPFSSSRDKVGGAACKGFEQVKTRAMEARRSVKHSVIPNCFLPSRSVAMATLRIVVSYISTHVEPMMRAMEGRYGRYARACRDISRKRGNDEPPALSPDDDDRDAAVRMIGLPRPNDPRGSSNQPGIGTHKALYRVIVNLMLSVVSAYYDESMEVLCSAEKGPSGWSYGAMQSQFEKILFYIVYGNVGAWGSQAKLLELLLLDMDTMEHQVHIDAVSVFASLCKREKAQVRLTEAGKAAMWEAYHARAKEPRRQRQGEDDRAKSEGSASSGAVPPSARQVPSQHAEYGVQRTPSRRSLSSAVAEAVSTGEEEEEGQQATKGNRTVLHDVDTKKTMEGPLADSAHPSRTPSPPSLAPDTPADGTSSFIFPLRDLLANLAEWANTCPVGLYRVMHRCAVVRWVRDIWEGEVAGKTQVRMLDPTMHRVRFGPSVWLGVWMPHPDTVPEQYAKKEGPGTLTPACRLQLFFNVTVNRPLCSWVESTQAREAPSLFASPLSSFSSPAESKGWTANSSRTQEGESITERPPSSPWMAGASLRSPSLRRLVECYRVFGYSTTTAAASLFPLLSLSTSPLLVEFLSEESSGVSIRPPVDCKAALLHPAWGEVALPSYAALCLYYAAAPRTDYPYALADAIMNFSVLERTKELTALLDAFLRVAEAAEGEATVLAAAEWGAFGILRLILSGAPRKLSLGLNATISRRGGQATQEELVYFHALLQANFFPHLSRTLSVISGLQPQMSPDGMRFRALVCFELTYCLVLARAHAVMSVKQDIHIGPSSPLAAASSGEMEEGEEDGVVELPRWRGPPRSPTMLPEGGMDAGIPLTLSSAWANGAARLGSAAQTVVTYHMNGDGDHPVTLSLFIGSDSEEDEIEEEEEEEENMDIAAGATPTEQMNAMMEEMQEPATYEAPDAATVDMDDWAMEDAPHVAVAGSPLNTPPRLSSGSAGSPGSTSLHEPRTIRERLPPVLREVGRETPLEVVPQVVVGHRVQTSWGPRLINRIDPAPRAPMGVPEVGPTGNRNSRSFDALPRFPIHEGPGLIGSVPYGTTRSMYIGYLISVGPMKDANTALTHKGPLPALVSTQEELPRAPPHKEKAASPVKQQRLSERQQSAAAPSSGRHSPAFSFGVVEETPSEQMMRRGSTSPSPPTAEGEATVLAAPLHEAVAEPEPWESAVEPAIIGMLPATMQTEVLMQYMEILRGPEEYERLGQQTRLWRRFADQLSEDLQRLAMEQEQRWVRFTSPSPQGTELIEILLTADDALRTDLLLQCNVEELRGFPELYEEAWALQNPGDGGGAAPLGEEEGDVEENREDEVYASPEEEEEEGQYANEEETGEGSEEEEEEDDYFEEEEEEEEEDYLSVPAANMSGDWADFSRMVDRHPLFLPVDAAAALPGGFDLPNPAASRRPGEPPRPMPSIYPLTSADVDAERFLRPAPAQQQRLSEAERRENSWLTPYNVLLHTGTETGAMRGYFLSSTKNLVQRTGAEMELCERLHACLCASARVRRRRQLQQVAAVCALVQAEAVATEQAEGAERSVPVQRAAPQEEGDREMEGPTGDWVQGWLTKPPTKRCPYGAMCFPIAPLSEANMEMLMRLVPYSGDARIAAALRDGWYTMAPMQGFGLAWAESLLGVLCSNLVNASQLVGCLLDTVLKASTPTSSKAGVPLPQPQRAQGVASALLHVLRTMLSGTRHAGLCFLTLPDGAASPEGMKSMDSVLSADEETVLSHKLWCKLLRVAERFCGVAQVEDVLREILKKLLKQRRNVNGENDTDAVQNAQDALRSLPLSESVIEHPRHAHRLQWRNVRCLASYSDSGYICDVCCYNNIDSYCFNCEICGFDLCAGCAQEYLSGAQQQERVRRSAYWNVTWSPDTLQALIAYGRQPMCRMEFLKDAMTLLGEGITECSVRENTSPDRDERQRAKGALQALEGVLVDYAKNQILDIRRSREKLRGEVLKLLEELPVEPGVEERASTLNNGGGLGAQQPLPIPADLQLDPDTVSRLLQSVELHDVRKGVQLLFEPFSAMHRSEPRALMLLWHSTQAYLTDISQLLSCLPEREVMQLPECVTDLVRLFCDYHMSDHRAAGISSSARSLSELRSGVLNETEHFLQETANPSTLSQRAIVELADTPGSDSCKNAFGTTPAAASHRAAEPRRRLPRMMRLFLDENRATINTMLHWDAALLKGPLSFLFHEPHLIDLQFKIDEFNSRLQKTRTGRHTLSINRQNCLKDSFIELMKVKNFTESFPVRFTGEEGSDAGGLTREWFQILCEALLDERYGLFVRTHDGASFHPNPLSYVNPDHIQYFHFAGVVVALAIVSHVHIDMHFTQAFYRQIIGLRPVFSDLQSFDPELYQNLNWMTENDVTDLALTFAVNYDRFGVVEEAELEPEGKHKAVTNENKQQYIRLLCEFHMTHRTEEQQLAFLKGFYSVIPRNQVQLFSAAELELVMCGMPDIDVEDLRAHTSYEGYSSSSPQIRWFWEAVTAMSKKDRANLLQFATGSSRVPHGGFRNLEGLTGQQQRFTILRWQREQGGLLPQAHTCFNRIDLPEYPSAAVLKEKLMIAITMGSLGFTMV